MLNDIWEQLPNENNPFSNELEIIKMAEHRSLEANVTYGDLCEVLKQWKIDELETVYHEIFYTLSYDDSITNMVEFGEVDRAGWTMIAESTLLSDIPHQLWKKLNKNKKFF